MGMLRPLRVPSVRGKKGLGNWPGLLALVAGFTVSAAVVGILIAGVGGLVLGSVGATAVTLLLVALLCAVLAADLGLWGLRLPMLRRQTPKDLVALPGWARGLVWGLDTGTIVSTFRTSGASWAALFAVGVGGGPELAGLAYAAAFCVPLLIWVAGPGYLVEGCAYRALGPDSGHAADRLMRRAGLVRMAARSVMSISVVALIVSLMAQ